MSAAAPATVAAYVKPDLERINAAVEELPDDSEDNLDDVPLQHAIPPFTTAIGTTKSKGVGGYAYEWEPFKILGFYFYGGNGSGVGNIAETITETYPKDDPNYARLTIESKDVDTLYYPADTGFAYEEIRTKKPTKADVRKHGKFETIRGEVAFIITYKLKANNAKQARNTIDWFKAFEAAVAKHTS
jgi:hypothetical protein